MEPFHQLMFQWISVRVSLITWVDLVFKLVIMVSIYSDKLALCTFLQLFICVIIKNGYFI